MLISTRGRYALRILLDLAEHRSEGHIPMKSAAERQGLSIKYIEQIMPVLSRNGLVEGVHGKGGGYTLSRTPGEYTVGEILRLTDGNLAPVSCLECNSRHCERSDSCKTLPMWVEFQRLANAFFDGITLEDLMNGKINSILGNL